MILQLLILGVLPATLGFALYPRLTARPYAWLLAFGAAAALAAFVAATAQFWWLSERTEIAVALSRLAVALGMGLLAGGMVMAAFVGLFGGADPVTPRPLNRIIATATTALLSILVCRYLIELQRGMS